MANLSVRRLYWPTQETVTDWLPTAINTAGAFDVATDGMLLFGRRTKSATLVWTTTDLWSVNYIGSPFLFGLKQEGTHCGAISQNAAVVLDSAAYWMGVNKFFAFDGFVKTIPCDVTDYVFGNFNTALAYLVWAFANPTYNEVTWYYPSANASTTDRYVTYNYVEQHWVFGTMTRVCGVSSIPGATLAGPVLIGSDGTIYDHETGSAHSGVSPSLESGPVQLGDGDEVLRIQRIVPDDKTAGQVTASLYTAMYPDATETLNGPYTLSSPTSVRLTARQVRLKITEAVAASWRVGVLRLGAVVTGRR